MDGPVDRQSLLPHYEAAAGLLGIDDLQAEEAVRNSAYAWAAFFRTMFSQSHPGSRGDAARQIPNGEKRAGCPARHGLAARHRHVRKTDSLRSQVASTPNKRFKIQARFFVLACGGIENARLLLVSNRQMPNGIGNQHDLVGRYFMEHPRVKWGCSQVSRPTTPLPLTCHPLARRAHLSPPERFGINGAFGLALRPEIRASERLLGSRTWIKPGPCVNDTDGSEALHYLAFWLRKGRLHRDLIKSWLYHPSASRGIDLVNHRTHLAFTPVRGALSL